MINTGVQISLQNSNYSNYIFLDMQVVVQLLDLYHMVFLFLIFQRISILFSIETYLSVYIPTNNVQGCSFPHILTSIDYLLSLS